MAKTFTVAKNSFPDNLSNEEFAANVKEWLDGLSIEEIRRERLRTEGLKDNTLRPLK